MISQLLDRIQKIDLGPLIERVGKFMEAMKRSFGTADFAELLSLSVQAGFEEAAFYGGRFTVTFCAGLAAALPEAIAAGLQASMGVAETFCKFLYDKKAQMTVAALKKDIASLEAGTGQARFMSPEARRRAIARTGRKSARRRPE